MAINPYSKEALRQCCAHLYHTLRDMNLQPAREDLVRPGARVDELVGQTQQIWLDAFGQNPTSWPWNDGFVVQTYIDYRKLTERKKQEILNMSGNLPLFTVEKGFVYFIRSEAGNIKIGWTDKEPHERLKALQTGSDGELTLAGWMDGTVNNERALHIKFAPYRIRRNGEWFRPAPELLEFIRKLSV